MKREIIKRLISLVIILFGLSLMTFGLTYILPSNPAEQLAESMGAGHDREVIAKIEEKYGLDKSFGEQYVNWLKGALHGDFGMSVKYAQPVSQVLGRKLPNTVKLAVASFILMILISFPLGILSAVYKDKKGELHFLTPYCPHLKCVVDFCKKDQTWTCPCHQSVYDAYGHLMEGPSLYSLKKTQDKS